MSSNGTNSAAIFLWVLIVIIVIIIIVWIACECSKKNKKNVKVVAFGDGKNAQENLPHRKSMKPNFIDPPSMTEEDNQLGATGSNWTDMEMPFAEGQANVPYEPYGAGGSYQEEHKAHGSNYPTEQDNAARFPNNPPVTGSGGASTGPDSVCAPAGNSTHGYNLNVDSLMPASWRSNENCGAESEDSTQWAAYAPSKAAFDSYITTAGSSRLAVNTRTAQARNTGLPNLLRDAVAGGSSGPVPIGTDAVLFNDSDFRQTLIYNSTGNFPELTWC